MGGLEGWSGGMDAATWQALGLVLTLVGLGVSAVLWSRKGPVAGLRGVAWSLLPLAAGLTGVLRLAWQVTDSVVSWGADVVFSPVVWLGIALAMTSLVLFVVTGVVRRRGASRRPRPGSPQSGSAQRSVPSTTRQAPGRGTTPAVGSTASAPGTDDDMADIEEILRRHGIT
jgi:hypothetical protein